MANDWASGVGGVLSSAINAVSGTVSSSKQYKYSRALMKAQQEWAEHAARHAHQWEVEDLRAAGLNPLLSIDTSGAVAHTPGTPSISAPDYGTVDFSESAKYLSGEKKRERELQEQLIENAKKEGKRLDAAEAKTTAETARILKHTAEGVGTPIQTKNVVYNVVGDLLGNLSSAARIHHETLKENVEAFIKDQERMKREKEFERRKRNAESNF